MLPTPGCSAAGPDGPRSSPLPEASDEVCRVSDHADPVAAVREAHRRDRLIALRTSGTSSGVNRAVLRTTRSWFDSFGMVASLLEMTARSRVWIPGPLSSTMNLFAAVHADAIGATVVPDLADSTHAHLTPAALARLCSDAPVLTGVHVLVAGDRLGAPLRERATSAGARVSHYYGAAELSFVAWGSDEEDLQPLPEVEVSVRDGEIWARSPYLCAGYDGAPGPMRTDHGWATVGDRGVLIDGHLRVLGRGDDVATTAGVTVLVAEVEQALRPCARGEVHVLGVPHPDLGQVLVAVLTDAADLPEVRSRSRRDLAPSHRPRLWFQVPDPPLTPAGKVNRAALARFVVSPAGAMVRLG